MPEVKSPKRTAGWTKVAFGDVVRLCTERSSDPEADGFERYIGLEHLDPGELRVRRWGDLADGVTFTNVFRHGQVLFGKRRAYQRKVALADFSGVCSGDIYVLEPKGGTLLPALLPFICQTDEFLEHAVGTSAGSLSPRTNWDSLSGFEFALPPIEEQHRAAQLLSAIEAQADRWRTLHNAIVQCSDAVVKSLVTSASHGQGSIRLARLDTVTALITDGEHNPPKRVLTGIPHVLVTNVRHGRVDTSECTFVTEADFERVRRRYQPETGDVLVVCVGATVGRCGVVGSMTKFSTDRSLAVIRFNDAQVDPRYGYALLTSQLVQQQILRASVGSAQPHLYLGDIRRLEIPVPPLPNQRNFVRRFSQLQSAAEVCTSRSQLLRATKFAVLRSITP